MTISSFYRWTTTLLFVAAASSAAACGAASSNPPHPAVERAAVTPSVPLPADLDTRSCARKHTGGFAADARLPGSGDGSSIMLAYDGPHQRAYVADPDGAAIHVFDAAKGIHVATLDVGGRPRQLALLEDGRLIATIEDRARVVVFEQTAANALEPLCARPIPGAPWGVAVSRDGRDVVVTSTWENVVTVLAASDLGVRGVVAVPRSPRGVIVDEDRRAFVTHLVGGKVSRIDLDTFERGAKTLDTRVRIASPRADDIELDVLRSATQGYALTSVQIGSTAGGETAGTLGNGTPPKLGEHKASATRKATAGPVPPETRILAPMVSVDPGDVPTKRGHYYYSPETGVAKETAFVATIDPKAQRPLAERVLATWPTSRPGECLLPRAITRGADGSTVFLACFGIDAVLELDALSADASRGELRRFDVPEGPSGVTVDAGSGTLLVHSELARTVVAYSLRDESLRFILPLPGSLVDGDYAHGRSIFYRTDNSRISDDGVACASCHPDGLDDGLTWFTPEGARQTPMLAGRLQGTAPYGWSRAQTTLSSYVSDTVLRLGGTGLEGVDLKDLVTFIEAMPAPPNAARTGDDARRGRDLFHSEEVGCASCHTGALGVDARSHDVASPGASKADPVDTPSLRFIRGTAPYFHDGRYATLEDLLADPKSSMGSSAKLSASDRASLAAYLMTL